MSLRCAWLQEEREQSPAHLELYPSEEQYGEYKTRHHEEACRLQWAHRRARARHRPAGPAPPRRLREDRANPYPKTKTIFGGVSIRKAAEGAVRGYAMTPNSRPTFSKAVTAWVSCSRVCAAETCTRMRASPLGTTG